MSRRLPARVLSAGRTARNLQRLIQTELRCPVRAPLGYRLWALSRGFLTESAVRYGLTRENAELYMSDAARFLRTPKINGPFAEALNNKIVFSRIVASHGGDVPEYYALIADGTVTPIGTRHRFESVDDIVNACLDGGAFIVKPRSGGRGYGVMAVAARDGRPTMNYEPVSVDALRAALASVRDGVVSSLVRHRAYAEEIFPRSTNSMRVLTMWDIDREEPFIVYAAHRFGRPESVPTDNYSRGGVIALVDLETGVLGQLYSDHGGGDPVWYDDHPDTGARVAGLRLPDWDRFVSGLLDLCREMSYIPYIGWDVVLTDSGFTVIEGNNYPDVTFQFFFPLLEDPRIRRFYEHHGVIRPVARNAVGGSGA
jgi:hypothetical protein